MSRKSYRDRIVARMMSLGTYREEFDLAIDSLANIMDSRDKAYRMWQKSGGDFYVSGEKMDRTHPLLKEWENLNTQALAYMKELSLTHQAMKRRAEASESLKTKTTLFEAMANILDE